MDSIKVVFGLGNPGARYQGTRHNIGFEVVECLARRHGTFLGEHPDLRTCAWHTEYEVAGRRVILAEPRTYMNDSGRAAKALSEACGVGPAAMLVVHDDADLAFGFVRFRRAGGDGGHNGLRSLIEHLETPSFARLKIGVRGPTRASRELADYVLDRFEPDESGHVEELIELGADAVDTAVTSGLAEAMNRYNGRTVEDRSGGRDEQM